MHTANNNKKKNLLGRTRTMWSGYSIMISCIYVNIVYMLMLQTAETRTRTDVSVGAVHDTKDNVLETDYFTDNYVDNIRSPVIVIANLSTILDNDLTDLLDVPTGML